MKKIQLLTFMLFANICISTAIAQTFTATASTGQLLRYTVISGTNVGVSEDDESISGNLIIPASVSYNGTTYTVTSFRGRRIGIEESSIRYPPFTGCIYLTSVTIPNTIALIEGGSFEGCSGLTSIIIPNSVTAIGYNAFSYCSSLTSVAIPNSVTSIGDMAFSSCSGLTSVFIPNSVTAIGEGSFSGCNSLTSMVVEGDNPYYDSRDNCNAIIHTSTNTLIAGCPNTMIPNTVISIGNRAFSGCDSLISVAIPNSVTAIGNEAFYYCRNLTSVAIPNSVTAIGNYAFSYCSSLTSVAIPNSVTSIGGSAFGNCSGLRSITFEANNPPTIFSTTFENVSRNTTIIVPCSTQTTYMFAQYYDYFNSITENCGNTGPDTTTTPHIDTVYVHVTIHDTIQNYIHDTVQNYIHIHDTIQQYVYDTIHHYIHDTIQSYIHVHDTVLSYIYDTILSNVHDTALIYFHDTIQNYIHDTIQNYIYDTVQRYIYIHDTILRHIHDTIQQYVYDTIQQYIHDTIQSYIHVHDTIQNDIHDTVHQYVYDTVQQYIHDTALCYIYVHDTVSQNIYDTIVGYIHDTIQNYIYDTVLRYVNNYIHDTIILHSIDTIYIEQNYSLSSLEGTKWFCNDEDEGRIYLEFTSDNAAQLYYASNVDVRYNINYTYQGGARTGRGSMTRANDGVNMGTFVVDNNMLILTMQYGVVFTYYLNENYDGSTIRYNGDTVYIYIPVHDTVCPEVNSISPTVISDINIYTVERQIVVEGAASMPVTFYDMQGRTLETKQSHSDQPLRFDAPATGVYMIRVSNLPAQRVAILR